MSSEPQKIHNSQHPLFPHLRDPVQPPPKPPTRELTSSFLHHPFFPPPPPQAAAWNSNCRSSGDEDNDDDLDDDDEEEEDEVEINRDDTYIASCSNQKMNNSMKEGNVVEGSGDGNNDCENNNKSIGETRNVRVGGGEMCYNILSDPLTGMLMDDAMILPCGHSFGSGGIQQVSRIKACCTCSQPVSEGSIAPNLSLRLAVQAYRREEYMQVNHSSKRKRERYDRDKGTCTDSILADQARGRGVQFPFVVTDRVIIKGNKRTPQRFVGREAIVTTQCLNGWYVVKTLDNAESVKLQYRSLAKVTENNNPSLKLSPMKTTPNWL